MRTARLSFACCLLAVCFSSTSHAQPSPSAGGSSSSPAVAKTIALRVRVILAAKRQEDRLDPKLADLFGSLRNLTYDTFDLKEEKTLSVVVDGETKMGLPGGRTLVVSPRELGLHNKKRRVRVKLDVPELKFSSRVWINEGATLVVGGGPKLDDGALLFAVSVNDLK